MTVSNIVTHISSKPLDAFPLRVFSLSHTVTNMYNDLRFISMNSVSSLKGKMQLLVIYVTFDYVTVSTPFIHNSVGGLALISQLCCNMLLL